MRPEIAQRWQQQLAWLDGWFGPEKADRHGFDPAERELFEALSHAWLTAEDKIGALEATSARFGRDRVRAMIDRLCADETSAYWAQLAVSEGRTLDDLVRLLWEPLPTQDFERTKTLMQGNDCCDHAYLVERLEPQRGDQGK